MSKFNPNIRNQLDAVAQQVIKALQDKVIIHRYDAYSTASIYLKFDYGVANSLRISDHPGKAHLAYRFNIGLQVEEPYHDRHKGFRRDYYPVSATEQCIADILTSRRDRLERYHDYSAVLRKAYAESREATSGFFSHCYLVSMPVAQPIRNESRDLEQLLRALGKETR